MELDRAVRVLGPATLLLTFLGLAWAVQAADTCPGKGTCWKLLIPESWQLHDWWLPGFQALHQAMWCIVQQNSSSAHFILWEQMQRPEWMRHLRDGAASACPPIMETEAGFQPPWATCPPLSVKSAVMMLCGEVGLVVPAGQIPVRYSAMITITERQGVRRG